MTERERLIELIGSKVCEAYDSNCDEWQPHSCEKCYANDCRIGDLADYLLANGVIVPPCKVGDTVYSISGGKVAKGTAESIHQNLVGNERGRWIVTAWFDDFYANTKEAGFECGTHLYPPFENFGKTVFISLEEAEKVLAERSKE